MAGLEITIIDNTELILSALEEHVARALTVMAETAEGYAKLNCPVDTGRLRASIAHEINTGEKSAMIGTNVEYGPYVELGTSKMSARPFLRPAVSDHTGEYQQIIETVLRS